MVNVFEQSGSSSLTFACTRDDRFCVISVIAGFCFSHSTVAGGKEQVKHCNVTSLPSIAIVLAALLLVMILGGTVCVCVCVAKKK